MSSCASRPPATGRERADRRRGGRPELAAPGDLIIELDGPQFHLDAAEDLRKQRAWEAAGWTVRRIPTDDVYLDPERLLARARPRTSVSLL